MSFFVGFFVGMVGDRARVLGLFGFVFLGVGCFTVVKGRRC